MNAQTMSQLEGYLQQAQERHASDVFLIPGEPACYRLREGIERVDGDVLTAEQVEAMAVGIVGQEALARIGPETGEVLASHHIPGVLNAQICVAKSGGACTMTARVLPTTLFGVDVLGVPKAVIDACDARNGLVVIGGPVGSGKTTTCYALLDDINARRPVHICTVEEPIGIRLGPKKAVIQQREIGRDAPDTISAIRASMRQDFDVLFVPELRRAEEVQACVTAAQTFALVITQVHAQSPEAAIQRMIDVQPEDVRLSFRKSLAEALRIVMVQILLPHAARKGRVAAYGVLVPDDEMRTAIAGGGDPLDRSRPLPEGCQSLADHVRRLAEEGTVTPEVAREAIAGI
ncbi:MAG: Flp pilus assembly complex ATPase component TadA [Phycisphaerae bacterium]|nr:Flp pilus assembly complex ATPase component TadA [Phycisphaerae bacterium]